MVQWYSERIATPTTEDEVYGYWVFVFGILIGIFGILLYLSSYPRPASFPGEAGIALSAIALVLVMIGPVIRLPLQRTASLVSYAGALVSFLAVVWFMFEYPGWRNSGMATPVITLYAVGLVLIALGAVFVPVVRSPPADLDEEATVGESPAAIPTPSKARFELFEDRAGKWRWRLRRRNGNVIADSGQGYASRTGAIDGIRSVKRNAPNAEATLPDDLADGSEDTDGERGDGDADDKHDDEAGEGTEAGEGDSDA
ncbi:hypothetical protein BRC64_09920 [Halobacteriales archaeon QH_10_67_22]|nr:MAG: hypothetical protein BRC64_09920 [Halobacteriales archaeon QH_10_67_22]